MSMMSWLLVALVGVMTLVVLYWMNRMYGEFKDGMPDRERWEYASSRGLMWCGAWQISLAVATGYMGTMSGSITLIGAGLFLMFAGWFQWRTRGSRLSE